MLAMSIDFYALSSLLQRIIELLLLCLALRTWSLWLNSWITLNVGVWGEELYDLHDISYPWWVFRFSRRCNCTRFVGSLSEWVSQSVTVTGAYILVWFYSPTSNNLQNLEGNDILRMQQWRGVPGFRNWHRSMHLNVTSVTKRHAVMAFRGRSARWP